MSKKWEKVVGWTVVVVAGLFALGLWVMEIPAVHDWVAGWKYEPDAKTAALEESLELSEKGERIWRAVWPAYQPAAIFNELCDSHDAEVRVLGCYVAADDRIYIYEVTTAELVDMNKVTAAHELLHAVWARMDDFERSRLTNQLESFYLEQKDWFDAEVGGYPEDERIGEIYTRAATKLRELPEGLERHYAEYFQNRAQIVTYYENYLAPFEALEARMEELDEQIDAMDVEIETARTKYQADLAVHNAKVDKFNACADTANCFKTDAEFQRQRNGLLNSETSLENRRTALNTRIDEFNELVVEYQECAKKQGALRDGMNSNLEKKGELEDE